MKEAPERVGLEVLTLDLVREARRGLQCASPRPWIGEVALEGVELLLFEAAREEVEEVLEQHANVGTGNKGGELAGIDQLADGLRVDAKEARRLR